MHFLIWRLELATLLDVVEASILRLQASGTALLTLRDPSRKPKEQTCHCISRFSHTASTEAQQDRAFEAMASRKCFDNSKPGNSEEAPGVRVYHSYQTMSFGRYPYIYHRSQTILFSICPYHGNFDEVTFFRRQTTCGRVGFRLRGSGEGAPGCEDRWREPLGPATGACRAIRVGFRCSAKSAAFRA